MADEKKDSQIAGFLQRLLSPEYDPSRRDALKAAAAGAAAVAASNLEQVIPQAQAQEPKPPKERFTLPAGTAIIPNPNVQIDPILFNAQGFLKNGAVVGNDVLAPGQTKAVFTDTNGYLHLGMNLPPYSRADGAQIVLAGPPEVPNSIGDIRGARLLTKKHFTEPEENAPDAKKGPYIELGQRKVYDVVPDSVAFMVVLKPQQNIQVTNMPETIIVQEKNNADGQAAGKDNKVITNNTQDPIKLVLIVPPNEYKFSVRGMEINSLTLKEGKKNAKAEDFETIEDGMLVYSNGKIMKERYPGTNMADAKEELLSALKPMVEDMYDHMLEDLLARKKDPKRPAVFTDEEVKQFSGPLYDAALKHSIIKQPGKPTATPKTKKNDKPKETPDGIFERFNKKFKIDNERSRGKLLKKLEANEMSSIDDEPANKSRAELLSHLRREREDKGEGWSIG